MAQPIANFNYSPTEQIIQFNDLSSNGPTTWAWDFGNGVTSVVQDPLIDYGRNGFYIVTLVVTNGDGTSTVSFPIGVSNVGPVLSQSIYTLINQYIPPNVIYDTLELSGLLQKQQLFIHPLVKHEIEIGNIYNEFYYEPLENTLIAALAAYDILIQQANASIVANNNGGSSATKSVKKIVTGPTEVEWYGDSESSSSSSSLSSAGGLGAIINSICSLALRLNIYIPEICGKIKVVIPPIIGTIVQPDCEPCNASSNTSSQA